jgi:hypothetical protein
MSSDTVLGATGHRHEYAALLGLVGLDDQTDQVVTLALKGKGIFLHAAGYLSDTQVAVASTA